MPEASPPVPTTHRQRTQRSESRRWFQYYRERHPWLHPVVLVAVATVGTLLILAGIAMLVLPGPGIVAIFAGFGILATEFIWARRAARRGQVLGHKAYSRFTGRRARWAHRLKKRTRAPMADDT